MGLQAARISAITLGFVAATLPLRTTYAESCPTPVGAAASLATQDSAARLQFLRDSLRETARQERRFAIGWGLTYVGLAAGSWAILPLSDDRNVRIRETYFNTATSLAGAGLAVIQPLLTILDHRRLERWLDDPVRAQQHSRCVVLAEAERHLAHAAKSEDGARSVTAHLSNIGISISLGLIMAYGLQRPNSAPLNTAMGLMLGELGLFTRPSYASRSLERYRQGTLTAAPRHSLFSFIPMMQMTSTEYTFALAGTF